MQKFFRWQYETAMPTKTMTMKKKKLWSGRKKETAIATVMSRTKWMVRTDVGSISKWKNYSTRCSRRVVHTHTHKLVECRTRIAMEMERKMHLWGCCIARSSKNEINDRLSLPPSLSPALVCRSFFLLLIFSSAAAGRFCRHIWRAHTIACNHNENTKSAVDTHMFNSIFASACVELKWPRAFVRSLIWNWHAIVSFMARPCQRSINFKWQNNCIRFALNAVIDYKQHKNNYSANTKAIPRFLPQTPSSTEALMSVRIGFEVCECVCLSFVWMNHVRIDWSIPIERNQQHT